MSDLTLGQFADDEQRCVPPAPGSPAAVLAGCTCPQLCNNQGQGIALDEHGKPVFWVAGDCPLHGSESRA